ncbi:GreA/GreB family elongation factor [Novosphingobium sp. Chol11]|uniref:GreA/GreB family elongation factor n=1 Tax=Novosphingobium sp. Chol11 TaxID=1385763 RepID=UPI0025D1EFAC|nr:GreA/GreB family elongation factor [Novosphingobium sp. Chol11]
MSVAFRRESDEEHLEPKFAQPIPPGPNLVTAAGMAQIEAQAVRLEAELGAASDEAAITALKRDLKYWQARRASAEIQPPASGAKVEFGTRVRFLLKGTARTVEIVGSDEADPAHVRLAFTAPLARALMGAEAGEALDFNGAEGAIEVLGIEVL